MSQSAKLLKKLLGKPKDFTWDELATLLTGLKFEIINNSGSSRKFYNKDKNAVIFMHQPHPKNVLKTYQILEVIKVLKESGYIK